MNIVKGRSWGPRRLVIYGPPGIGKSTFACKAELGCKGVLALDGERGLRAIGPDRVEMPKTWDAALKVVEEMCVSKGDWDTIVLDTADSLETLARDEVLKHPEYRKYKAVEEIGFQAGIYATAAKWRELLVILDKASEHGRSVHLVAHVTDTKVTDPTLPKDYRGFIAALTKHAWGATNRWTDNVAFADYERGMSEGRATMTGDRHLHTVAGTGFSAKHRPNIKSPIPLSWTAYEREFKRFERQSSAIIDRIMSLATTPELKEKASAFVREAGYDVEKLVRIEVKLEEKIETNQTGGTPNGQPAQAPTPTQEGKAS